MGIFLKQSIFRDHIIIILFFQSLLFFLSFLFFSSTNSSPLPSTWATPHPPPLIPLPSITPSIPLFFFLFSFLFLSSLLLLFLFFFFVADAPTEPLRLPPSAPPATTTPARDPQNSGHLLPLSLFFFSFLFFSFSFSFFHLFLPRIRPRPPPSPTPCRRQP